MKQRLLRTRPLALLGPGLGLGLLAASCGVEVETTLPELSNGDPAVTLGMPASLWSDAPLADPIEVRDARESKKDGDAVVLRGTLQDFGELSTFRLVDDALTDCTETGPDDHCETPWDYCCEDPDALARYTVNVEFLEDGVPGDWSLKGQNGLERLTEVVVAGTLRIDEAGNLRVEADQMSTQ